MRTINKERRSAAIERKIYSGSTWEELENEYMLTRTYMQTCLRKYCKTKQQYDTLLSVARANAKVNVIYISETGALLNNWGFLRGKQRVFVPDFCKREIEKISHNNDHVLSNPKICWANIKWERVKIIDRELKPRTISVASFCCAMAKRHKNSKVVLYTNSRDIAELVEAQTIPNISIVKF